MKQTDYIEGPGALQNFKQLATAILQSPTKKKKKQSKTASRKNQRKSDKD